MLAPWKKSYDKPRKHIKKNKNKKQRYHLTNNGLYSQGYGFSSSHMWEIDHKEGWVLKTWCFWTVVLEKTLEGHLDYKKIKPVNSKGNQSWIFFRETDAEAKVPILWTPDAKSWIIWKDTDAGKHWRRRWWGWQRTRWVDGITKSMVMSLSKFQEMVNDREAWHAAVPGVVKSWTWLINWMTTLN